MKTYKLSAVANAITYLITLTIFISLTAVRASGDPWTDPAGDVTSPNADIISGSADVSGGWVDLRVQFLAPPYPTHHTHHITWCLDTDQNPATGDACGSGSGYDAGFTLFGGLGALSTCNFSINEPGFEPSSHL